LNASSSARDLISRVNNEQEIFSVYLLFCFFFQLIRRNPIERLPLTEVIRHSWIIDNADIKSIDENYEKINKSTLINHKDEN